MARSATLVGAVAILLWSQLALLTAATGRVPPFQLAALTFFVGGTAGALTWCLRPGGVAGGIAALRQPAAVWALGIGGLFGYHALYFGALRLAPPAEAGLVAYLWPLLIVVLSAPLLGERLRAVHVVGALVAFAGLIVMVAGRADLELRAEHALGYACAGAAAVVWAGYSVLSRRMAAVPTDTVVGFCLATAALSVACHLAFERTVWPELPSQWLALAGLGLGPVGLAFYVWDIGVKRGDIRLLGILSYAAPLLSTLALILFGYAAPSSSLALACLLIVAGAVIPTALPALSRPVRGAAP